MRTPLPALAVPRSSVLLASAFMLASAFFFAVMHMTVRRVSAEVHPFEIALFRNFFGLLALLPWFLRTGLEPLRTKHLPLHGLRALLNLAAMLIFYMALARTPLVTVQALSFTAPMFAAILAALLLHERVAVWRWLAILAGFTGALIIVRPGLLPLDSGALLTLLSAAIWGFTLIVIKRLARTDSAVTVTAYMVILMTPLSLPTALLVWTWPSSNALIWLVLCGVSGTVAQLCLAQALRGADATVVLPLDFTKVVWGGILGFLAFGESADLWTWIGAAIIFIGATNLTYHERRAQHGAVRIPVSNGDPVGEIDADE